MSKKHEKKFKDIGEGSEFDDFLYNFLHKLGSGSKSKIYPEFMNKFISDKINLLLQKNIHNLNKRESLENPMSNLIVPKGESINMPCIWAIELYPPSELAILKDIFNHKGWDKINKSFNQKSHNDVLKSFRATQKFGWWKLATFQAQNSKYIIPNSIKTNIPTKFDHIDLHAIQVGSGLTAIIGKFSLNESFSNKLTEDWHKQYEPQMLKINNTIKPLNRKEVATNQIKAKKNSAYSSVRRWMKNNLPGFFSTNNQNQPLFDLNLFEILSSKSYYKYTDAYYAIGLDSPLIQITTPELPNIYLTEIESSIYQSEDITPLWTLWGNRKKIFESLNSDQKLFIQLDSEQSLSNYIDMIARYNLLLLAVTSFLTSLEKIHSEARDQAIKDYNKFNVESLKKLRSNFFTISLNLSSLQHDLISYWDFINNYNKILHFDLEFVKRDSFMDMNSNQDRVEDFNKMLEKRHKKTIQKLINADESYRNIINSITSLSVSEDNSKIGRMTIYVSISSLIVAGITLLFSDIGSKSIVQRIISYILSLI